MVNRLSKSDIRKLKKLCRSGSAAACTDLGILFREGPDSGVEHDVPRAASLFASACADGDGRGCAQHGALQLAGQHGVTRDGPGGLLNIKKGCEMGDSDGCFLYGRLLYAGRVSANGKKEPDRAAQYFLHACSLQPSPCADACAVVGSMFWERCADAESSDDLNCMNAAKCLGRGCEHGSSDACEQVREIYPAVGSACAAGEEDACKLKAVFKAAMQQAVLD